MTIELRKPRGRGGIGCKRAEGYPMKRLKKTSQKKARRNMDLREKKEIILNKMHEQCGITYCQADPLGVECFGNLELDHVIPRSRCLVFVDEFINLQILCKKHHMDKTYIPGMQDKDYRTEEMKKMMCEL